VSREFIVEGARDLADSRLDQWIGEGLGAARVRLGSRFDHLFTTFPEYDFIWRGATSGRVLAGRIVPSCDRVGRKHPFCVFAVLEMGRDNAAVHLLVLSLRGVFEKLRSLVDASRVAGATADVLASVRTASASEANGGQDEGGRATEYARFAESTPGFALWRDTFGDRAANLAPVAMRVLQSAAIPTRQGGKELTLGIRIPLPCGSGIDPYLAVSFWWDLFAKHVGRPTIRATLFWTEGRSEFGPSFFLFPPEPAPSHWVFLVDGDAAADTMSRLDDERHLGLSEAGVPDTLREVLESPAATLRSYLSWAGGSRST
jgi:type VI secretion system ImpM family protein